MFHQYICWLIDAYDDWQEFYKILSYNNWLIFMYRLTGVGFLYMFYVGFLLGTERLAHAAAKDTARKD